MSDDYTATIPGDYVFILRCPSCDGMGVTIDRFNHARFSDCPLCKGRKKIKLNAQGDIDKTMTNTVHY